MRWSPALVLWWLAADVGIYAQYDQGQIIFPDDKVLQRPIYQNAATPRPVYQTQATPRPVYQSQPTPRPSIQTPATPRSSPQPFQQPWLPLKSSGKSAEKCRKYAESVFMKIEGFLEDAEPINTCNLIVPLIVNGTVAEAREFPHMALIGAQGRQDIKWICGGSLISERYVLSAAHCVTNTVKPKRVRLGDYNIMSRQDDMNNDARSVEFDIIETIKHPQYDEKTNTNDIVLFKLDKDVVFNEYVRPICLQTEYQVPDSYGIISGWGSTDFGEPRSALLLKGNVSFVPGKDCMEALNPSLKNEGKEIKDDIMVCAANYVNGTDTCQGDSGGPLQYRLEDPYCMYSQVGITSFGVKCGLVDGPKKYPGVYTRVSNYVPWIESIVWP